MTGNVEALLPGVEVLLDTDDKWAQQPLRGRRGVIVEKFGDAGALTGFEYVVCIGLCSKTEHTIDCFGAIAFRADELLLVPDEAAS